MIRHRPKAKNSAGLRKLQTEKAEGEYYASSPYLFLIDCRQRKLLDEVTWMLRSSQADHLRALPHLCNESLGHTRMFMLHEPRVFRFDAGEAANCKSHIVVGTVRHIVDHVLDSA